MGCNLEPLEFRVIVLPDIISDKLGKAGIIEKAVSTKTQDRRTQTKGTIVALSDVAFTDWKGKKPKVGDRIEFAMYAGQFYRHEEIEYRIMNDDDIVALVKET